MIYAYDELYLENARRVLATMLDYAVYTLRYTLENMFQLFVSSSYATSFERGNPSIVAGKSGIELALLVLEEAGENCDYVEPEYHLERTPEYWCGWALAYYQWKQNTTFAEIASYASIDYILSLYNPYHEMDIGQFVERMNLECVREHPETRLKRLRMYAKLSQSELAKWADVPLRTLQQYEQRQKDINRARAEYVIRLAQALECRPDQLLES